MGGTDFIVSNARMSRQHCVTNANDRPRIFPRRFGMQAFMPQPVKYWPWTMRSKNEGTLCADFTETLLRFPFFVCYLAQWQSQGSIKALEVS